MTAPLSADELIALRAPIEQAHNATRDAREKQFVADKVALEKTYLSDLAQIRKDKEAALVTAGLNFDGSDPQGRQQGSVE